MAEENKDPKKLYKELRRKEEEDLARMLAPKHGIPYLDLSRIAIDIDALKIITEEHARENNIAVISGGGKKIQVVTTNPERSGTKQILEDLARKRYQVQLFLVSPTSLQKVIERYKEVPPFEAVRAGVIDLSKMGGGFSSNLGSIARVKSAIAKLLEETEGSSKQASLVLEIILAGALSVSASDIHIEGGENDARIRYRIDGVLQDVIDVPVAIYNQIISRLKLVSDMKLNIRNRPQDGRYTIITAQEKIEVRNSTLPGPAGESVVMRLLLPKAIETKLPDLGMQPPFLAMIERELEKPNGMILTTGPTGSGKTTTLYAFIKKLSSPEEKTITIEDPIEYRLPHITQTQVDHARGYTFGSGLRSIVRQDPDIILVGEIRDLETAEIAVQAALTGHLVFSTLHTNDAAGVFPRLIELGIKPSIIAPAVNVAMAQRLVRRLCQHCKQQTATTAEERKIILESIERLPKEYKREVALDFMIWKAPGCEACNFTGYKGRVGVYEAFLVNDEMERFLIQSPAEADIRKTATEQGMLTMFQDGILKIIDGITTLEELARIVSPD